MKTVGELFATGEMQLPFVLQSAETMKAAVSYLEPHMEKADQGGKGTVVLATVKGDVHDIGKNLVDIILTNNGYEIVNLGIKVNINEMLQAVEDHKADAIGMSGLLVKSTLIMRENLEEMNTRNLAHIPVLLGGARPPLALPATATSKALTCATVYEGTLLPGKDAFEGLRTMDRLVELKKTGEDDAAFGREQGGRKLPPRKSQMAVDENVVSAAPCPHGGRRQPRLHAAVPRLPGGQGHPSRRHRLLSQPHRVVPQPVGVPARAGPPGGGRVRRRVQRARQRRVARRSWTRPRPGISSCPQVAYGYYPANAEGNDVVLWTDETRSSELTRFAFPRQKKEPWLCIADFFRSVDSGEPDYAAFMVVTMGPEVVQGSGPPPSPRTTTSTT